MKFESKKISCKSRIPLAFVKIALVAITTTFGSQFALASTATEVSRFLKVYRIGETQRLSLEAMIHGAVRSNQIPKESADCVLRDLVPRKLAVSARPVVEEHFTNEASLKAINDFFETKLGKRILDHGGKAHAAAMKEIAAGRQPVPMAELTLSPDEAKRMDAWEKSLAYADFMQFVSKKLPSLEAIGGEDLKAAASACQAKNKNRA